MTPYITASDHAAHTADRRAWRRANRVQAARDYPAASARAAALGLTLVGQGNGVYTLGHPAGWALTIYAGPRWLHSETRPFPPRLDVPDGWRLGDVVEAAGRACR